MQRRQFGGHRKAQAVVARVLAGGLAPVKTFENALFVAVRHAGAVVRHPKAHPPAPFGKAQFYLGALRGKAQGIVHQNGQQLPQAISVGLHRRQGPFGQAHGQPPLPLLRQRLHALGKVQKEGVGREALPAQPGAGAGPGAEQQQLVHQRAHPLCLAVDDPKVSLRLVRLAGGGPGVGPYHRQRGAQFVAGGAQKLLLLVHGPGHRAHRPARDEPACQPKAGPPGGGHQREQGGHPQGVGPLGAKVLHRHKARPPASGAAVQPHFAPPAAALGRKGEAGALAARQGRRVGQKALLFFGGPLCRLQQGPLLFAQAQAVEQGIPILSQQHLHAVLGLQPRQPVAVQLVVAVPLVLQLGHRSLKGGAAAVRILAAGHAEGEQQRPGEHRAGEQRRQQGDARPQPPQHGSASSR